MDEKTYLAKRLFHQGYSLEKILQITNLNRTYLELKIEEWKDSSI